MKIGIITAMSSEQKQVEQLLANKKEYVEGPFQYTEGTIQNNTDRKSTRLNSSHNVISRMPSSA